jgi:hypothetical protein
MRRLLRPPYVAAAVSLLAALHCAEAARFVVTTTADDGAGSLRQAIADANANATDDIIVFDLPGPGPHIINLIGALTITSNVEVLNDATSRGAREPITVQRSRHLGFGEHELFWVIAGRVVIAGLTLRDGNNPYGGAIEFSSG